MSAPPQANGASKSTSDGGTAPSKDKEEPLPQLGALEEDDEFEEFAAEDWEASESDLSYLVRGGKLTGTNKPGDKTVTVDSLWKDNWDDDDIEDDFSKQLRAAIKDDSAMQTS